ncbi:rhodanese-like domain-containing protein [Amorphus coralli]|uniref:rhodanese-like domain-containing protein n=1 Tax=Amorphus coralli TaxID=340680 RepID=UPI00040022D3|nr:rhodanese-like domain-containing protein [Amorphus coralli]
MAKTETIGEATLEILTPEEVAERFDRNEIVLVDVRTPAEFAFEHIKGALLLPLSSFDAEKLPGQSDKALVFHCGSGIRSRKVAEACAAAGITQLAHMDGGFGAWKSAGLAYLAVDPATGSMVAKP